MNFEKEQEEEILETKEDIKIEEENLENEDDILENEENFEENKRLYEEELKKKIKIFTDKKKKGMNLNNDLKNQRDFYNPSILDKIIDNFDILEVIFIFNIIVWH
jgi:hypothetical protein